MLTIILSLLLLGDAQAQQNPTPSPTAEKTPEAKAATPKSKSASFFEDDEEPVAKTKSSLEKITAKVRVVREDYDGVEVFFEGEKNRGTYFLHRAVERYATHLKSLESSKKPQGPWVTVEFDKNKHIKSVELVPINKPDPNKTWDFSVPSGQ